MVGHELQAPGGNRLLVQSNGLRKFLSLRSEGLEVLLHLVCALGVALTEDLTNDVCVDDRVRRVGPQMRVRLAILLREGEVEDVVLLGEGNRSQLHQLGAIGHVGLRHGQRGIFQLQTVDEHNIRVA